MPVRQLPPPLPTILIVDDMPDNLGIELGHLSSHGFTVNITCNGDAGLAQAQSSRPDIILLDISMPGLDGFETCRRLKADQRTRDIPVIFMTALADNVDRTAGLEAGGLDYVSKPIQIAEVLTRVETHLALNATQKQLAVKSAQLQHEIAVRRQVVQTLYESEERYRTLIEEAPDAIVLLDCTRAHFIDVNTSTARLFGMPKQELLNTEFAALSPPLQPGEVSSFALTQEKLQQALAGESKVFEWICRDAAGRDIPCDVRFVLQAAGGHKLIHGVIVDITERKRAEALRAWQSRILEMIAGGAPLNETLDSLMLLIESQSDGLICTVLLLDEDGLHVHPGSAPGLPESYGEALDGACIGPNVGSCGTAMYRREPVIVTDILIDPLWQDYRALAAQYGLRSCWSSPIFVNQGRVLGSFGMYYREPRSPGPSEWGLIGVATHMAGIAIERKRAEEELKRHRDHLQELVSAQTANLQKILQEQQAIFDNAIAGIELVKLGVIERCNHGWEEMLGYGHGELDGKSTRIYYASEASWEAHEEAMHDVTGERQAMVDEWEFVRKDGSAIWCSTHCKVIDPQDPAKGAIRVYQDISDRKRTEAALLEAKHGLERGLAEVEQTYREVTLLSELSSFLQTCQTPEEAYAGIGDYGAQLFPGAAGTLFLLEADGNTLAETARWGEGVPAGPAFPGTDCLALRNGQIYRVDNPAEMPCCPHRQVCAFPYTCLPLIAQGETFGLLTLEHRKNVEGSKLEMRHHLAVALAEQTGLALANLRLKETLRQQSIRDPLTGLYNRRYMNETILRELARAKRKQATLAIAMLDVDYFKQFNDTFGHEAGDQVLQAVAGTLEHHVRQSDVVCRFGGEEFVVLLPDISHSMAEERVGNLLEAVRRLDLTHGNRTLGRITASLGLAFYPMHGDTPDTLIEAADAALYQAKEAGRNRVVVCGSHEQD